MIDWVDGNGESGVVSYGGLIDGIEIEFEVLGSLKLMMMYKDDGMFELVVFVGGVEIVWV